MFRLLRHILHFIVVTFTPGFLKPRLTSCQEIAEMIDSPAAPTGLKAIKFRAHIFMCNCCYDYELQIKLIKLEIQKPDTPSNKSSQEEIINLLSKK